MPPRLGRRRVRHAPQFRRRTGCVAAEALYYLEAHNFRIGDAIRARAHEVVWERERAELVRRINQEDEVAAQRDAEEAAAAAAASSASR